MRTVIINKNWIKPTSEEVNKHIIRGYRFLELLEDEYPGFRGWYFSKVVPQLHNDRSIILKLIKNEIAGISILKDNAFEKKICTFRVLDKFQGIGIGTQLMEDSLTVLKTKSPIITVSETRLGQFNQLLSNFNFKLNSIHLEYYLKGKNEYSFNGALEMIKHEISIY